MASSPPGNKPYVHAVPTADLPEFLPIARPSIDATDIDAVTEVLRSGWITSGARVRQLEQQIKGLTGSDYAVAVGSATAGLQLVLHAMGVGPGDEVITPSMTWVSTVNLVELCGATPVFVDVDRDTLMTTAEQVAGAITARTKMIIPVHFAGAPLDLTPLRRLAAQHSMPLVEDAAHALGSEYCRVPVGHSGTSIFSFQAIKNVTTAEGGVICTSDSALAKRLRALRFHGLGADAFDRQREGRLPDAEVLEPGFKCNLPDMNACLALGQLERLRHLNRRRAELAQRYLDAFRMIDEISPLALPSWPYGHAWHLFVVRLDLDRLRLTRAEFMNELKARQIGTGLHFRAVHTHRYYANKYPEASAALPNTHWNSERIVSLPLFPAMTNADIDRVVAAIGDIIAGSGS